MSAPMPHSAKSSITATELNLRAKNEDGPSESSGFTQVIRSLAIWSGRLGYTDIYHENVKKRGFFGAAYVLIFGTPHLGSYANGIYLKRVLKSRAFKNVLDAGCGDGTFSFYVASHYNSTEVLGVDVGEQGLHGVDTTLDVAQKIHSRLGYQNLSFRQHDLRELDLKDSVDLIFSFDVLEHIAENDAVLANMHRALVPGGELLLRIPNRVQKRILNSRFTSEHARWAAVEHVGQHHDLESLLSVLRGLGFRITFAKQTMGFWGRLSFELSEMLKYYRLPEVLQFACIPLLKLIWRIDTLLDTSDGDGLLVLCQK